MQEHIKHDMDVCELWQDGLCLRLCRFQSFLTCCFVVILAAVAVAVLLLADATKHCDFDSCHL